MKNNFKQLLLAAAATALISGSASAATVLHIAGSTAYRSAVTAAIINYLSANGGGTGSSACTAAYVGSSASQANLFKAGQAIFKSNDGTLIVKTNWTGSVAGVVDLVENNTTLKWFPNSESTSAVVIGGATQHGTVAPSTDLSATVDNIGPELAMSDSYFGSVANLVGSEGAQGTTDGNDILNSSISPAGTGTLAFNDQVGVVPFGWWIGATGSTASGATNISQQVAYLLTLRGNVPVSTLTGSSSQKNDFFYLIGRNEDSGTRTAALIESQGTDVAANNVSAFSDIVKQYQASFSNPTLNVDSNGLQTGGSGNTLTGLQFWPASSPLNTETNLNWNTLGHSGYIAGGDVKNVLLATNSTPASLTFASGSKASEQGASNNAFLIGYLGWADGFGVSSTPLTYNGVSLSAAHILSGEYSFWTYEHAYVLTDSSPNAEGVASNNSALADGIVNLVSSTYAPTDSNGNTATANFPISSAGADANEDNLTLATGSGGDNAAPAGLLIDSASLTKRTIEGGPLSLTY